MVHETEHWLVISQLSFRVTFLVDLVFSAPNSITHSCPPLCCRRCFLMSSHCILLHLCHRPKVSLLATCSVVACPFSSPRFLLLQARTFANKVSFPMGIFALYIIFTTYATPLASLVIPRPFFVPGILLFNHRRPPFPSIPNQWQLMFRVVLQDEAHARPSCLRRLPSNLVNVPYSVSAPERDSYKPPWRPSDRGSGVRHLDDDSKCAKACERSCGR